MSYILFLLEIVPVIVFFTTVKLFDIFLGTMLIMISTIISILIRYLLTKKISYPLLISFIVLMITGNLTLFFEKSDFIKMKPSIVFLLYGIVCYIGATYGKFFVQDLMPYIKMTRKNWLILSRRISYFFFLLVIINEITWRFFSESVWINFKVFGSSTLGLIFYKVQSKFIKDNNMFEQNK